MDPITDVREISRLAYGFKASKALLSMAEQKGTTSAV